MRAHLGLQCCYVFYKKNTGSNDVATSICIFCMRHTENGSFCGKVCPNTQFYVRASWSERLHKCILALGVLYDLQDTQGTHVTLTCGAKANYMLSHVQKACYHKSHPSKKTKAFLTCETWLALNSHSAHPVHLRTYTQKSLVRDGYSKRDAHFCS